VERESYVLLTTGNGNGIGRSQTMLSGPERYGEVVVDVFGRVKGAGDHGDESTA
jgi:hypothetical protein